MHMQQHLQPGQFLQTGLGIEPFFGRQFSMWHYTKRCSSIFDLGPVTPKINSPKFCTKSPISRLAWQIDHVMVMSCHGRCLGLLGGFRGWPIQWNHTKCCGADSCCHGNENLANLGYFFTKIDFSFFVSRRNRAIFWHSTKCCSSMFDLGP